MKMRKVISTVLAGVLALSTLPISAMSAGAAEGAYAPGDVDMDGVITGHDAAVREAARVTEEKVELDESEKEQMNQILAELLEKYQGHPPVSLTCFCPDQHKSGGEYRTIKGKIKKIDHTRQKIYLENQESIGLEQIVKIEEQKETDFI